MITLLAQSFIKTPVVNFEAGTGHSWQMGFLFRGASTTFCSREEYLRPRAVDEEVAEL